MANRVRRLSEAAQLAEWQLRQTGRELRLARIAAGMRLVDVARPVGISASQLSRMERGHSPDSGFRRLAKVAAAVGLKLTIHAYPAGGKLLDGPQLRLFDRLKQRAHPSWQWRTEVPMPIPGDLRAADACAAIPGCRMLVELYTRLSDYQRQSRSAMLKARDLGADRLILVLWGTAANRRALREAGNTVQPSFPLGTKAVLAALAAGRDPGANGIVLL